MDKDKGRERRARIRVNRLPEDSDKHLDSQDDNKNKNRMEPEGDARTYGRQRDLGWDLLGPTARARKKTGVPERSSSQRVGVVKRYQALRGLCSLEGGPV